MKSTIKRQHSAVIVQIPYNQFLIQEIKKLGGKWIAEKKAWELPLEAYDEAVKLIDKKHSDDYIDQRERIRILKEDFIREGLSSKTIKNYINHIKAFLVFTNDQCNISIMNQYLLYLLEEKKCSHAYNNQAINAIKRYARKYSTIDESELIKISRPKKEHKHPKVMSKNEIFKVFEATSNTKHKTALMMAYSCGLRVSEVANLKIQDIDSDRMVVYIKQSKGRKDRTTTLAIGMLKQLRLYYKEYKPKEWLFENPKKDGHITERTLQKVFINAVNKVGIKRWVTFHSLRHSFATHMHESGTDIRFIQELLGHSSSKTTEIYTHVSTRSIQKITNPLDTML